MLNSCAGFSKNESQGCIVSKKKCKPECKLLVRYEIVKGKLVFGAGSYNHGIFLSIKKCYLFLFLLNY